MVIRKFLKIHVLAIVVSFFTFCDAIADSVITGYSPSRHHRFYVGSDKDFIGDPYDFSGVGSVNWTAETGRPQQIPYATMIDNQHFATANHAPPAPGEVLVFVEGNNPFGPQHKYIVGRSIYNYNDVWIGRLLAPIPAKHNIKPCPIADFSIVIEERIVDGNSVEVEVLSNDILNTPTFLYGCPGVVGTGKICGFIDSSTTQWYYPFDPYGFKIGFYTAYCAWGDDTLQLQGGDSGLPTFVVQNNELRLIGTHFTAVYEPIYSSPLIKQGIQNAILNAPSHGPNRVHSSNLPSILEADFKETNSFFYFEGEKFTADDILPAEDSGYMLFRSADSGGTFSSTLDNDLNRTAQVGFVGQSYNNINFYWYARPLNTDMPSGPTEAFIRIYIENSESVIHASLYGGISQAATDIAPILASAGIYGSSLIPGWNWVSLGVFELDQQQYTNFKLKIDTQFNIVRLDTLLLARYTGPILTISGRITNSSGLGVAGITLEGLPHKPVSDSDGFYSDTVPYGWNGTIVPSKNGYNFVPQERSYPFTTQSYQEQDYIADVPDFLVVDGYVRTINGSSGIPGVQISGLPEFCITDSNGYFRAVVPFGWSGTILPQKTGILFIPGSRNYQDILLDQGNQYFWTNAIGPSGAILAWGNNSFEDCNVPAPNRDFSAIAGGALHSLGLKSNGSIVAWGYNGFNQCNVPLPNSYIAAAAGSYFSMGLRVNSSIEVWGDCGNNRCIVPLPNENFIAISAGAGHCLGLKTDGIVKAWGLNTNGQCNVPVPNSNFVAVAANSNHSLGLKDSGSIVGWGSNTYHQIDIPLPNQDFVSIATGNGHSLGLKNNGSIVAWGKNDFGQCNVPTPNSGFIGIAAGLNYSAGLKSDGSVVIWGTNNFGQQNIPGRNINYAVISAGSSHVLGIKLAPGDLNTDFSADFIDFALLAEYFGKGCLGIENCSGADMNYDGLVNISDLQIIIEHWLEKF